MERVSFNKTYLTKANFENAFLLEASFHKANYLSPEFSYYVDEISATAEELIVEYTFARTQLIPGHFIRAARIDNSAMTYLWENSSVSKVDCEQEECLPNFDRAILSETVWFDGEVCAVDAIGECKLED